MCRYALMLYHLHAYIYLHICLAVLSYAEIYLNVISPVSIYPPHHMYESGYHFDKYFLLSYQLYEFILQKIAAIMYLNDYSFMICFYMC